MTDIERLEKYIRRRNKWSKHDLRPNRTDLQKLREQEIGLLLILVLIFAKLMDMTHDPVLPRELHLIFAAVLLVSVFVFYVEVRRTGILVEIFQRTAIQKAEDVVNEIKRRDAASASQNKPAS